MRIEHYQTTIPLHHTLEESWPGDQLKSIPCDGQPFEILLELTNAPRSLTCGLQLGQQKGNKRNRVKILQANLKFIPQINNDVPPLITPGPSSFKRAAAHHLPRVVVPLHSESTPSDSAAYRSPPHEDSVLVHSPPNILSSGWIHRYADLSIHDDIECSIGSPHPRNSMLIRPTENFRSPSPPPEEDDDDNQEEKNHGLFSPSIYDQVLSDYQINDFDGQSPCIEISNSQELCIGAPPPRATFTEVSECIQGILDSLEPRIFSKNTIPCTNWGALRNSNFVVDIQWTLESFDFASHNILRQSRLDCKDNADCVLDIDGQTIYVDSSVLSEKSTYFSALLKGSFLERLEIPINHAESLRRIHLQDLQFDAVYHCLEWMYTSTFSSRGMTIQDLLNVYMCAELFDLDPFLDPIEEALSFQVDATNFGSVYIFAAQRNKISLMTHCLSVWKEAAQSISPESKQLSIALMTRSMTMSRSIDRPFQEQVQEIIQFVWDQGPHELASFMTSVVL